MSAQSTVGVPLSTDTFVGLVDFLRQSGSDRDPVQAVEMAIEYWIENASQKPYLLPETAEQGYMWKNLFLPDGTKIRMPYKGKHHYAEVVGDEILYNGELVTPAQLANMVASSSRNAWRDLWIRRPGESQWHLADKLRRAVPSIDELLGKAPPSIDELLG